MDWTRAVDNSCDRTGRVFWGFWNDPFKAWSNLSFVFAAAWGATEAAQARPKGAVAPRPARRTHRRWLHLFHTFANRWSERADTFPIWIFVTLYVPPRGVGSAE